MQTARVSSIDALRTFKAALQQFMQHGDRALIEADLELQRVQDWVRRDQPAHWSAQVRKRQEQVEQARSEVRRVQFSLEGRPPSAAEQKKALKKAQQRLEEAQRKLELTRHWQRQLEHAANEYKGQVQHFASALEGDLPRALASIDHAVATLESYTAVAAPANVDELTADEDRQPQGASAAVGSRTSTDPSQRDRDPLDDLEISGCRAIRRLTLGAPRRQEVPDLSAESIDLDNISEPLITFRDRVSLPRIKPARSDRVVVDPRIFSRHDVRKRVYLERLHVEGEDDSGWHIGIVERREGGVGLRPDELRTSSIGDVLRTRPHWRELISLPHGYLAVLEGASLRCILAANNEPVLESSADRPDDVKENAE